MIEEHLGWFKWENNYCSCSRLTRSLVVLNLGYRMAQIILWISLHRWRLNSKPTMMQSQSAATSQCWTTVYMYSRKCILRSPLGAAKTSLKRQVVYEMRVTKTCPCKVNTFFSSKWKQNTFTMHLQLYTLISYIFPVQSFHKRWFQAYTSLQQFTCVLYCGPVLRYIYM